MKTILVTGGSGFLGANLCHFLLDKGCKIICLDNFYSSSKKNIEFLLAYNNFSFIQHDVIYPIEIDESIDQIYHLACPASPVYYQKDHIYTLKTCFLGSLNILNLARQKQARILLASTSEIYGDPEIHPQTESYFGNVNSIGPRSCYDEGKRVAESLFINYFLEQQVDIRIVRIFNTYGPLMNENDGRVISNFIIAALKNENLIIYGEGNQTRSFCYVDDMINGFYKVMRNSEYIGPINLGNSNEITMKQLAGNILNIIKSDSMLIFESSRTDDPRRRKPDISKAKINLNWYPKIILEDGLKKTIDYFSK